MNSNALKLKIHLHWKKWLSYQEPELQVLSLLHTISWTAISPCESKVLKCEPNLPDGHDEGLNGWITSQEVLTQLIKWSLRTSVSNQGPGNADAPGPGISLPQPLLYTPGCESGRGWLAASAFCRMTVEHMHPQRLGFSWHSGKWFNNMTWKRGPTFCLIVCVLTPT